MRVKAQQEILVDCSKRITLKNVPVFFKIGKRIKIIYNRK